MMITSRTVTLIPGLTLAFAAAISAAPGSPRAHPKPRHVAARREAAPQTLPCGDVLAFQVLLDRQGFSSGQIDGAARVNTSRALTAFQNARHLSATGKPDCDTWRALAGDAADPAITTYDITAADAEGPFT